MGKRLGQRAVVYCQAVRGIGHEANNTRNIPATLRRSVFMVFASLFLGSGLDAEVNTDSPVLRFFTPKMAFLAARHALAIGHRHSF